MSCFVVDNQECELSAIATSAVSQNVKSSLLKTLYSVVYNKFDESHGLKRDRMSV